MAKDYARPFYDSKEWRKTRTAYLQSQHYICERCGGAASVVHHIRYIKPWNVNDPDITLNWDNLKAVCEKCHTEEHSQDMKARGQAARLNGIAFDEEGNVVKQANVFLVCGSPASGKTTYVIRKIYFDDCTKRAIASGGGFKDENEVARVENAAMLKLRRDEALKALHNAHFPDDPAEIYSRSPSPLNIVIAAENWEEWITQAAKEIQRFENGL